MGVIYNFAIIIYRLVIIILSPFNEKADLWYSGRKGFFSQWQRFDAGGRKVIWFHCASLGEFEQGRPVIEEMKNRDSNIFILLTFFSPSGFEIRKNYPFADAVCYLPADTPANACRFIDTFRPVIAVFVKYEFWYNYIARLKKSDIPLYLISANFRSEQIFFKWYGGWFRRILHMFSHIFVQSEISQELLKSVSVKNVSVVGDTRFDRVSSIAAKSKKIPVAEKFSKRCFTLVAGSTWPADNSMLIKLINKSDHDVKLIIAPHEIHENEIETLSKLFRQPTVRYSLAGKSDISSARVLIIDNIGMLSSLYIYGDLAYIGGGFGKGIHNILEACAQFIPVIFGPRYQKFLEANELIAAGGAFPVIGYDELVEKMSAFYLNRDFLKKAGDIAGGYVQSGTGASNRIVSKIMNY